MTLMMQLSAMQDLTGETMSERKVILGTDWWTDVDDCVALRVLCNAHKKGEIELIGVGINGCMEYSAPSVNAFLTAEGLGDIPIGVDLNGTDFDGDYYSYQKPLCDNYYHTVKNNKDCEDAATLYKRLLCESDSKVDIIEIGFMSVIASVLETDDGIELFKKKVNKVYAMAGRWDRENGEEHNFNNNLRSRIAGNILCEKCPVPIVFLGFEAGLDILTGDGLPEEDVLGFCITKYGCQATGRHSWDPMTALLAIVGDTEKAGYGIVTGTAYVDRETGQNNFKSGQGQHSFVVKTKPDKYYRDEIQKRIKGLI